MWWADADRNMKTRAHSTAKAPPIGCFQGPDMERCASFWSSLHPSASFAPSALRSLLLCSCCISGSPPWPCLWGQRIKYIKGTSRGSCHFEIPFIRTRVYFCNFCCTIHVCLIYGACYPEQTFSCVFVRSYSPEDVKHPSLSTKPGSERTNPSMRSIPTVSFKGSSIRSGCWGSVVMPVGCSSLPLRLLLVLTCLYLFLSCCSHAVVSNFCLCLFFLGALFPRCDHMHPERRWGNSTPL